MRALTVLLVGGVVLAILAVAGSAHAAKKKHQPLVLRSASGTVIQPTRTIIHNTDGSTTVIVVPRRSYLDPGTDVPVGYGSHMDYAFPPDGNPGQPNWFYGPDLNGVGGTVLARPYWIPGFNPYNPF
ncbi:MAG TPA: hypothetical protein VK442_05610 [Xanthobacteraceae bacterium]|nr:hypothetical protein [Xanthobacteraceae bacterium]